MYESYYLDGMSTDKIRQLVIQKMEEKRLNKRQLSLMLRRNEAYIDQYLTRRIPEFFPENIRQEIAVILGIEEEKLKAPVAYKSMTINKSLLNRRNNIGTVADIQFGPDTVPILGSANGSSEAFVLNFDEPIGEILRHPGQKNMNGAFAIEVRGSSMTPRYKAGWIVYPIANKYPRPDQGCIIEMKNDGEAFLKVFIRETEKEIICMQYNPEKEWKRLKSDIKALHSIAGTTE